MAKSSGKNILEMFVFFDRCVDIRHVVSMSNV